MNFHSGTRRVRLAICYLLIYGRLSGISLGRFTYSGYILLGGDSAILMALKYGNDEDAVEKNSDGQRQDKVGKCRNPNPLRITSFLTK